MSRHKVKRLKTINLAVPSAWCFERWLERFDKVIRLHKCKSGSRDLPLIHGSQYAHCIPPTLGAGSGILKAIIGPGLPNFIEAAAQNGASGFCLLILT